MNTEQKEKRYERIYSQLKELMQTCDNPLSRIATIVAILQHKMPGFFWTGFYLINENGELTVGPYQGPVACMKLQKDTGVCWAGINKKASLIVDDVEKFPGHIACDSRSKSEIVVPLIGENGNIIGILDIDSENLSQFDKTDQLWLEKINNIVF